MFGGGEDDWKRFVESGGFLAREDSTVLLATSVRGVLVVASYEFTTRWHYISHTRPLSPFIDAYLRLTDTWWPGAPLFENLCSNLKFEKVKKKKKKIRGPSSLRFCPTQSRWKISRKRPERAPEGAIFWHACAQHEPLVAKQLVQGTRFNISPDTRHERNPGKRPKRWTIYVKVDVC